MDTKLNTTTKKEIATLKKEVRSLRSFIISTLGKDTEGDYRPELVDELMKAASETPTYHYTRAGSLLKHLEEI